MSRFSCVLFDLDGTLIDSTQLILESYRHTLTSVGAGIPTDETIMKGFGTPLLANLQRMSPEPQLVPLMMEHYSRFNAANHDRMVKPFPNVASALDQLGRAGINMGIVTGKRRRYALMGLALLDQVGPHVSRHFASVVTPERTIDGKPDPEPVRVALRDLGCPPEEAVLIGDSPHDVTAARAAGAQAAAIGWGPFPEPALQAARPDYWVDSAEAIVSLVSM
ncbi:MAG: HAD-IA family hydrolase [Myxococcota bacterium]